MTSPRPIRSKRPRSQPGPLLRVAGPPVRLLTRVVGVPVLRLLEWLGWVPALIGWVGRVTHRPGFWSKRWRGYAPDEHDVIVCCYFKSGTNWTLQIAQQIAWRGSAEFDHIHDRVAWPDAVKPGYAIGLGDPGPRSESPTGLRVIKTHAPWNEIPYSPKARYVLVVRDPKDAFVSSYHFIRDVALGPLMPSVESWHRAYLGPTFPPGNWAEHAASYWRARELENVLFLSFKEMKQDLRRAVERIAAHVGVELSPEELERVLARSSFAYMKAKDSQFAPGALTPWSAGGALVRSGRQGGSSELLSVDEQLRIDETFQRRLRELGSDLDYASVTTPAA